MMHLLLKCLNIKATKSFYSDALQFEVKDSADGTCTVFKEGATLIFSASDLWKGAPHCTGTIYFFIDDIDDYFNTVRQQVPLYWSLSDTHYGTREFAVKDCNDYILAFAQNRTIQHI